MKIKYFKLGFLALLTLALCISCEPDDSTDLNVFDVRDRVEQQETDNDSIVDYFATHYYNASFFETGINHKIEDLVISDSPTDADGNPNKLLSEALAEGTIITATTTLFETDYTYYYMKLNQGGGKSPEFTDQVRVRYQGFDMEEEQVFDQVVTPINLPLTGINFTGGAIPGWQRIIPEFNTALDFTSGTDGVTNFNDYGFGVMFIPSGLAYYASPPPGSTIDAYDNLVFKFELLQMEELDHDGDGVLSYLEDLNNDGSVFDEDTDGDGSSNYFDLDDDGDGGATLDELLPTIYTVDTNNGDLEPVLLDNEYEISRSEELGVITINTVTIVDTDNNDIPDYLDAEITINYNEE